MTDRNLPHSHTYMLVVAHLSHYMYSHALTVTQRPAAAATRMRGRLRSQLVSLLVGSHLSLLIDELGRLGLALAEALHLVRGRLLMSSLLCTTLITRKRPILQARPKPRAATWLLGACHAGDVARRPLQGREWGRLALAGGCRSVPCPSHGLVRDARSVASVCAGCSRSR